MKTYTAKTNARRAAIGVLAKELGLTKPEVKAQIDKLINVLPHKDGGFHWVKIEQAKVAVEPPESIIIPEEKIPAEAPKPIATPEEKVPSNAPELEASAPKSPQTAPNSKPAPSGQKRAYERNGNVARVWDICEETKGQGLKRKDVIAKCTEQGINYFTARTQYQAWFKACSDQEK